MPPSLPRPSERTSGLRLHPKRLVNTSSMGYAWERTRYVPTKPPDPEEEEEGESAREELEALKRGHSKGRSS